MRWWRRSHRSLSGRRIRQEPLSPLTCWVYCFKCGSWIGPLRPSQTFSSTPSRMDWTPSLPTHPPHTHCFFSRGGGGRVTARRDGDDMLLPPTVDTRSKPRMRPGANCNCSGARRRPGDELRMCELGGNHETSLRAFLHSVSPSSFHMHARSSRLPDVLAEVLSLRCSYC